VRGVTVQDFGITGVLGRRLWKEPPVLVLGMHRSGTSVLAELLHDLGVWMFPARDRSNYAESRLFQNVDNRLLRRWGATWFRIGPALGRLGDPAQVQAAAATVRRAMRLRLVIQHFGVDYLRAASQDRYGAWGFKDPRATVLFPVWDRVFPGARVLHILRDGRDVALSILRREGRPAKTSPVLALLRGGFPAAFALWEEYVREGLRHEEALGERCLRLRYEDFQVAPEEHLRRVLAHVGMDASPPAVTAAAKRVRPSAARDPGIWVAEVAAARSPLAEGLGYD